VSDVYIDLAAVVLDPADRLADDDVIRSLRYLAEAGHRVVLVAPPGVEPPGEIRRASQATIQHAPDNPAIQSWYLTADLARCQGRNSARLRTVLIGGAPPSGSIQRCDSFARNVQAAVMEILAAEAMQPR
jgi:hypothetical protein